MIVSTSFYTSGTGTQTPHHGKAHQRDRHSEITNSPEFSNLVSNTANALKNDGASGTDDEAAKQLEFGREVLNQVEVKNGKIDLKDLAQALHHTAGTKGAPSYKKLKEYFGSGRPTVEQVVLALGTGAIYKNNNGDVVIGKGPSGARGPAASTEPKFDPKKLHVVSDGQQWDTHFIKKADRVTAQYTLNFMDPARKKEFFLQDGEHRGSLNREFLQNVADGRVTATEGEVAMSKYLLGDDIGGYRWFPPGASGSSSPTLGTTP